MKLPRVGFEKLVERKSILFPPLLTTNCWLAPLTFVAPELLKLAPRHVPPVYIVTERWPIPVMES